MTLIKGKLTIKVILNRMWPLLLESGFEDDAEATSGEWGTQLTKPRVTEKFSLISNISTQSQGGEQRAKEMKKFYSAGTFHFLPQVAKSQKRTLAAVKANE